MKKLELEKMIKDKELELEQLKKELEKVNKVGLVFEPKLKEVYYCVNRDGAIYIFTNESDFDNKILKNNLAYPTRELAEKARDRQEAKIRVIKEIARLNDGWIPGWEDSQEYKFFVYYSYYFKQLDSDFVTNYKKLDNNLYLKNRELAEQLIETHREDLLLMLEAE